MSPLVPGRSAPSALYHPCYFLYVPLGNGLSLKRAHRQCAVKDASSSSREGHAVPASPLRGKPSPLCPQKRTVPPLTGNGTPILALLGPHDLRSWDKHCPSVPGKKTLSPGEGVPSPPLSIGEAASPFSHQEECCTPSFIRRCCVPLRPWGERHLPIRHKEERRPPRCHRQRARRAPRHYEERHDASASRDVDPTTRPFHFPSSWLGGGGRRPASSSQLTAKAGLPLLSSSSTSGDADPTTRPFHFPFLITGRRWQAPCLLLPADPPSLSPPPLLNVIGC